MLLPSQFVSMQARRGLKAHCSQAPLAAAFSLHPIRDSDARAIPLADTTVAGNKPSPEKKKESANRAEGVLGQTGQSDAT